MFSVTQRAKQVKQPRGGYLNPRDLSVIELDDDKSLAKEENINPGLVAAAVEYMTRFMLGGNAETAFDISIRGARIIKQEDHCKALIKEISGLGDDSITNAIMLTGYDVCYRRDPMAYRPVETIKADKATIENVRIMVERSLAFFQQYGPIVQMGFTFAGGYTNTVCLGDGDFLTADTLWEFKTSMKDPTNEHTLQLLMYYIMGVHSVHSIFKQIKRIGIYNPRLNRVYLYNLNRIPREVVRTIESDVICY